MNELREDTNKKLNEIRKTMRIVWINSIKIKKSPQKNQINILEKKNSEPK
jgi:hypothetical protein